jgi:transposase
MTASTCVPVFKLCPSRQVVMRPGWMPSGVLASGRLPAFAHAWKPPSSMYIFLKPMLCSLLTASPASLSI